jgi:hypothetical protein
MTVAELITALGEYTPDTPVCVVVEDEFDASPPMDLALVHRRFPLHTREPYIELVGTL